MRFLAIIPARAGSKGVPKKNIKLLGKKPLIEYTINDAKNSKLLTQQKKEVKNVLCLLVLLII